MQSEDPPATSYGKKKRTKKDLSMMELIEHVKTHKSRVLHTNSEPVRHLPKYRSHAHSYSVDAWNKQYSDSDDDSDGAKSEPVRVERPPRPSTARGRRRVSVDSSAPGGNLSEQETLDSTRFEEELMTPNRSSRSKPDASDPPRSKSRMGNHRPLKYKEDDGSPKEGHGSRSSQGQKKGRSRNLPPLSRDLSSLEPQLQSSSHLRMSGEGSVLSSIQSRETNNHSNRPRPSQSTTFSLDRQRTVILEKS